LDRTLKGFVHEQETESMNKLGGRADEETMKRCLYY